ncbi:3-hydroxyacyl-CoA dehydrogenase family protein [Mechercharimyces sp. CAU 1602]|uniref:3-hydroxyacyl-CoA dehydrogenase family protein n=1 Tax=Mechercharimyces sp. CAU 1602 TaxID=2973933 RepID=UPI0021614380|nr:3-hydroxyacyl-CoA dehydrogenase NAD-binding domain-containing protein [Mechercharimyces sp. CAU 1602]MCS1351724.1 3-hydroxyacyl-CoA dehydrogenase NAD-binding domain-containing protein [Mechercharimyces sp. CAU 1602]
MIFPRIAVIGAGTMGAGIVECFVRAGCTVQLYDVDEEKGKRALEQLSQRFAKRVEKGKMSDSERDEWLTRIQLIPQLSQLKEIELVIEAVIEDLDVKRELFAVLESYVGDNTILATNTSSFSITEIAGMTTFSHRVLGLHFFNPAPVLPLVEVIRGMKSGQKEVEQVLSWVKLIGKEPVIVEDSPGFLVNRLARSFHTEAYRLVGERIASKEQVDQLLTDNGFAMGPFALQDLIGIDVNYAASLSIFEQFYYDARYRPHYSQRLLVEGGQLGRKSGRGHYSYEG